MTINKNKFSDANISQNLGKSGVGQVDLYNGNLTFNFADVKFNYGNPIISVSHVYSAKSQNMNSAYGNNWALSCDEKVEVASDNSYIKYIGASGSAITYYPLKDGVRRKVNLITNSNEKYYINPYISTSGIIFNTLTRECRTYDDKNNFKYFNSQGLLYKVRNTEGKELYYERTNGRLNSISDMHDRVVTFSYSDSLLSTITDSAGRSVDFAYSNNNLTHIYANTGRILNFTYNADKCITEATNEFGLAYKYSYDTNGRVTKVTKASKYNKITYDETQIEESEKTYNEERKASL